MAHVGKHTWILWEFSVFIEGSTQGFLAAWNQQTKNNTHTLVPINLLRASAQALSRTPGAPFGLKVLDEIDRQLRWPWFHGFHGPWGHDMPRDPIPLIPKYLSKEVIIHPNHHLRRWLDPEGWVVNCRWEAFFHGEWEDVFVRSSDRCCIEQMNSQAWNSLTPNMCIRSSRFNLHPPKSL